MTSKVETYTFRVGDRVVAKLVGGEVVKSVRGSKHFLRKPHAIAFDEQVIREADTLQATGFRVIDLETGEVYHAQMEEFVKGALVVDRGYGRQHALPLHKWHRQSDVPADVTGGGDDAEGNPNDYEQPGLFG